MQVQCCCQLLKVSSWRMLIKRKASWNVQHNTPILMAVVNYLWEIEKEIDQVKCTFLYYVNIVQCFSPCHCRIDHDSNPCLSSFIYLVLVELHLADDEHKVQLDSCVLPQGPFLCIRCSCCCYQCSRLSIVLCVNQSSDQFAPCACYQCSRLIYTLRKPKFQSICNFCNKDLKLACFVFFNIFHLVSDNMCGDCTSHSFNLRCSEIRALQGADVWWFWSVGSCYGWILIEAVGGFFLHSCWMHFHIISRRCNWTRVLISLFHH